MALAEVAAQVSAVVAALTPTVALGVPFTPLPAEALDRIEEWGAVKPRGFDVVQLGAPYAGDFIASTDMGFQSCRIGVRVAYPAGWLRERWQMRSAAAADAAAIYEALRDPANWSSVALEVTPEVETGLEEITGADGAIVGFLATVEMVAEWEV